jgi:hypothetical protein
MLFPEKINKVEFSRNAHAWAFPGARPERAGPRNANRLAFQVKSNFILNLETRRDAFPGDRPEGAGPENAF